MPAADIFAMAGQDNRAILAGFASQAILALMPVSRGEALQRAVIAVPAA
jgi:hypothetical protein